MKTRVQESAILETDKECFLSVFRVEFGAQKHLILFIPNEFNRIYI